MFARLINRIRSLGDVQWALSDQAMVSAGNFLTTVLAARTVGDVKEFGRFMVAWLILMLFKELQSAFIHSPMLSIAPKQRASDLPPYYGAVIVQQAAFSAASLILVLAGFAVAAPFFPELKMTAMSVALAAVIVSDQLQDFIRRYLYANQRPRAVFLNDVINNGSRLVVLFLLFRFWPTDSVGILWALFGCTMAAVTAGLLTFSNIRFDRKQFISVSQRHWQFSRWTTGTSVLRWLSSNLIIMMSGAMLGAQTIGAIRAAVNVLAPRNVMILGLTNIVLVRGSKRYNEHGAKSLRAFLGKIAAVGLAFEVPVAIFAFLFADKIMYYVYGPNFVQYSFILYWIACINIINFLTFPLGMGLQIIEYTKPYFVSAMIEAAFGVLASYFLISSFGLIGALFGLATTNVILLVCLVGPLFRRLK